MKLESKKDVIGVALARLVMLLAGIITGFIIYHFFILGSLIDQRAKKLGMMQYNGKTERMEAKSDYKWTLHYLKNGNMK